MLPVVRVLELPQLPWPRSDGMSSRVNEEMLADLFRLWRCSMRWPKRLLYAQHALFIEGVSVGEQVRVVVSQQVDGSPNTIRKDSASCPR